MWRLFTGANDILKSSEECIIMMQVQIIQVQMAIGSWAALHGCFELRSSTALAQRWPSSSQFCKWDIEAKGLMRAPQTWGTGHVRGLVQSSQSGVCIQTTEIWDVSQLFWSTVAVSVLKAGWMNPAGDREGGDGLYEGVVERPENVLVYSKGTELLQEVLLLAFPENPLSVRRELHSRLSKVWQRMAQTTCNPQQPPLAESIQLMPAYDRTSIWP